MVSDAGFCGEPALATGAAPHGRAADTGPCGAVTGRRLAPQPRPKRSPKSGWAIGRGIGELGIGRSVVAGSAPPTRPALPAAATEASAAAWVSAGCTPG